MEAPAGERRGTPLRPGDPSLIGRYVVTGRLGEGGMGRVYLGRAPDGRQVAVKVIRSDLVDHPFRERFRREAARARQVPSFCTAEVIDADPDHEPPYLVVEYVDGRDLGTVVREQGPLSPANVHALAIGVATALTAIHAAGVIHRDLKPSNVLLAPGSPKVIDFGLARSIDARTTEVTGAHELVGTVAYMAPERLSGADPTPAVDVFAWGAVVTFAATGRTPYQGDTIPSLAASILTGRLELSGVPDNLRELVAAALAMEPEQRPTPRQLLDRLLPGTGAAGGPTSQVLRTGQQRAATDRADRADRADRPATPPRPRPRRRRRTVAAVVAAALAAGLVTAGAVASGLVPIAGVAGGTPAGTPDALPPPQPLPTGVQAVLRDGLTAGETRWRDHTDLEHQVTCTVGSGLTAHSDEGTSYRCPNDVSDTLRDLAIYVDVTLIDPGSCASIWFRFTVRDGGYALRVCEDGYRLVTHGVPEPHEVITLRTLPDELALGRLVRVGIIADGNELRLLRDGVQVGQWVHEDFQEGQLALGLLQMRPEHPPPYTVRFADLEVWGRG